jgi:tetratricopeptide (TPR) repeat protein
MATDASAARTPETLNRHLTTSGPTLIILDGIQSGDVDEVIAIQSILESSESVFILATGRQALNLADELIQNVGPLELPKTQSDDVATLMQSPAVGMFVARAQFARPDFQVTPRNADTVRQLVARLDGIPLGIELMASWSRTLSPAQMLERLTSHQEGIQARGITLNTEHSSMHAAVETTFDMLSPECQKVFLRLATFSGGWNEYGAAALCPDMDVQSALRDLEEVCLISSSNSDQIMRFSMLDTVRAFAIEKATAPERADWSRVHAVYHYQRGLEFNRLDNLTKFEGLVDESANLRQAVEWFMDHDLEEETITFCALIGRYGVFVDRPLDVVDLLEAALDRFPDTGQFPVVRAEAMVRLASVYNRLGNEERAREVLRQAQSILDKNDDPRMKIELLLVSAEMSHTQADFDAECQALREALSISLNENSFRADRIYLSMGHVMVERHEWEKASELYQQSITEAKTMNDAYRVALGTSSLANLSRLQQNFTLAEELAKSALTTLSAFPGRYFTVDAQLLLALIYLDGKQVERSAQLLCEVIDSDPQTEWQREELCAALARYSAQQGDFALAARYFGYVRVLERNEGRSTLAASELSDVVRKIELELGSKVFRENYDIGTFWTWKHVKDASYRVCESCPATAY